MTILPSYLQYFFFSNFYPITCLFQELFQDFDVYGVTVHYDGKILFTI